MSDWINFAELRRQLNFADVLKAYKVELNQKPRSDQHVGPCPLPEHKDKRGNTFSANLSKGLWQCFGCKASGNTIDFAVFMEGCDKRDGKAVRKVAGKLRDRFVSKAAPSKREPKPEAKPSKAESTSPTETVVNQPLDFSLKTLESEHPSFAERKITAESVEHFALGFCKRGSLTGRIAVPLHDDSNQLVGYAGLATDEAAVNPANPRYIFPAPREVDAVRHVFDRTKFLYNGFRVGKAVKDLIVVQECHSVWSLWQGGFSNVVALMGDECGDDQAQLVNLLTINNARVWLLTDDSARSADCAGSFLVQVASSRLCRWIKVKEQEDIAPDHPLLAALPKR